MDTLFPEIAGQEFESVKKNLCALREAPPQVLLLEGATEVQRFQLAQWWACLFNCRHRGPEGPCLECETCRQIQTLAYRDIFAFDGRISNTEDKKNLDTKNKEDDKNLSKTRTRGTSPGDMEVSGLVRALNMENTREMLARLKDTPQGAGYRFVLLTGLGSNRDESCNALLKVLEEPSSWNMFVLLAPERRQVLPTIVSRSFCLTLPWADPEAEAADTGYQDMASAVTSFLRTGRGLIARTGAKSFDAVQAGMVLDIVQKALVRLLAGRSGEQALDAVLAPLTDEERNSVSYWTGEARAKIKGQISPSRVTEAFMMQLYLLCQRRSAG
ncbi:MAG: DNA polymerase III subunit delta' [Desulfovibrionaceae bacterium]|nr:DNA polymerase III subunit delta' [Desulfovibrionaceae bacterium]